MEGGEDPGSDALVWSDFLFVFEPSSLLLIGTAAGTVMAAALRALRHDVEIQRSGVVHADAALTLDHRHALAIPIFSSFGLLILFYFFHAVQIVLLLLLCVAGSVAIIFAAQPLMDVAASRQPALHRKITPFWCSKMQLQVGEALLAGSSIGAVVVWVLTGSWFLSNLFGICLCVSFISFVRLPNVKICTILLSALFCYDIFWVFFSESLFGQNVMVVAATKSADNPVVTAANALGLPSTGFAQSLDLPVKLVFPMAWRTALRWSLRDSPALMLGLGDMALPGMLVALLLIDDVQRWRERGDSSVLTGSNGTPLLSVKFWRESYVMYAWAGYWIGMIMALGFGTVFRAAQPALLYLVPCTLLPAVVRAREKGELQALWSGWEGASRRKESVV